MNTLPNQEIALVSLLAEVDMTDVCRRLCKKIGFKPDRAVLSELKDLDAKFDDNLKRIGEVTVNSRRRVIETRHRRVAEATMAGTGIEEAVDAAVTSKGALDELQAKRAALKQARSAITARAGVLAAAEAERFAKLADAFLKKVEDSERELADFLGVPHVPSETLRAARYAVDTARRMVDRVERLYATPPRLMVPWYPIE